MKAVAKLVMIDNDDNYLLMYRSDHPTYGIDPDLPGGTIEPGETVVGAMLREVEEEAGVSLAVSHVEEVYSGKEYSGSDTLYVLYTAMLDARPSITISWEHSSYEWISHADFIIKSKNARDTYMHMVSDIIEGTLEG